MSGGTSSTLPVRNPITRPVSFHSLPEHQRNNPVYLPPHPHRRPRTPRSSPLAGPSVSSDQVNSKNKDDEGNQKPRYRPNRISSIPDMVFPVQSLYDSDPASFSSPSSSPPSIFSDGAIGVAIPQLPLPRSSGSPSPGESDNEKGSGKGREEAEDGNRLRDFVKRLSIISTYSLTTNEKDKDDQKANKGRSSFSLHSASTTSLASSSSSRTVRTDRSQTAPPIPTIPRWALNAMREEAGIANRDMKYGHRCETSDRPTTSSSLPPSLDQPIPRDVRPLSSGLPDQPRPPSTSRDPGENWMSVTDSTPRFSRLGLGGDGVIMPVKKGSLTRMKSAGSLKGTRSTTTPSQPPRPRCDSWAMGNTKPSTRMDWRNDSNTANAEANLKEREGLRMRRRSFVNSLRARVPGSSVSSSTEIENVPPLPPTIKPDPALISVTTSHVFPPIPNDPVPKIQRTSVPPFSTDTFPSSARSATLRRDSVLAAINDNQLPPPLSNDSRMEFVRGGGDMKPQDIQGTRTRRKGIRGIVMRITTAPMSAGGKLKLTTIHDSRPAPVMVLSPDTLTSLDPPPDARFKKFASSSVPSLPSTKDVPEFGCGQSDGRSGKGFKSIKKRWNTVLATIRG